MSSSLGKRTLPKVLRFLLSSLMQQPHYYVFSSLERKKELEQLSDVSLKDTIFILDFDPCMLVAFDYTVAGTHSYHFIIGNMWLLIGINRTLCVRGQIDSDSDAYLRMFVNLILTLTMKNNGDSITTTEHKKFS